MMNDELMNRNDEWRMMDDGDDDDDEMATMMNFWIAFGFMLQ